MAAVIPAVPAPMIRISLTSSKLEEGKADLVNEVN
jgi:phenylpyruvate tautomerase PptA (4-oxalocrotonate tautomerase family)